MSTQPALKCTGVKCTDSKGVEDFAQWLKAVERQQAALEQQMKQFDALQAEFKGMAERANRSPEAARKLQNLQSIEQSPEYQRLQSRVVEKLQQIEQQFAQITRLTDQWLAEDKPSSTAKSHSCSERVNSSGEACCEDKPSSTAKSHSCSERVNSSGEACCEDKSSSTAKSQSCSERENSSGEACCEDKPSSTAKSHSCSERVSSLGEACCEDKSSSTAKSHSCSERVSSLGEACCEDKPSSTAKPQSCSK